MSHPHFINECPVCHATNQCRCMGPKTKTFNPCPGCKDKYSKDIRTWFEALQDKVADWKGPITAGPAQMPAPGGGIPATESDAPWTAIEVDKYLTHIWRVIAGRLQVTGSVQGLSIEDLQRQVNQAEADLTLLCRFDTALKLKGR